MRVTALRRETVNETPPAKDVTANVTGNVAATPLDSGAADANLEEKNFVYLAEADNKPKPVTKAAAKPKSKKGAKFV